MREWHVEHMQKTIVKFVTGLSDNASSWQKRQHKKYNNLTNVRKNITYDMKHGVTNEEVFSFFKSLVPVSLGITSSALATSAKWRRRSTKPLWLGARRR